MFEIQNETENILISEKYINTQVEVYQSKFLYMNIWYWLSGGIITP